MKVVARPLNGADLQEGFLRVRRLVYPQYNPEASDIERGFSIWRWLESHPLGNKMQRWFLVTEEGEVVGHLAATAQYYRINGQRVVAHTPADYMVLPKYGFHALTLMRMFFRSTENCVAPDVELAVIKVEIRLGVEEREAAIRGESMGCIGTPESTGLDAYADKEAPQLGALGGRWSA